MRLVLDSNVLLSALLSTNSPPAKIITLWRNRKFSLLTTDAQIYELARVTRYPKIRARLAAAVSGRLINQLRDLAILVENLPKVSRSPDPDDNYLLALAEAGQAQFLVTGDKLLLALKRHKSTRIVTPASLLDLMNESAAH